jgi:uroporphyrinogen decarboxylase
MNSRNKKSILSSARGERPWRNPVWFLRQAGRYLPEYRAVRAAHSFLELCNNPQIAAEVSLQPLKRFDGDGAIIFSDILVIPHMLGQNLCFGPEEGPQLSPPIRGKSDLATLKAPEMSGMLASTAEAIKLVVPQLADYQTMIGFAGAPCTVACYMIEGRGSTSFSEVKKVLMQDPLCFTQLLELLVEATFQYLVLQIDAGAEIVMLFDSWAGHFSAKDYRELVLPATQGLIARVKAAREVPVIYYPGQGQHILGVQADIAADVYALDWRFDLASAVGCLRQQGMSRALQGNLDPLLLSFGNEAQVRAETQRILQQVRSLEVPGHIFNVGHGLLPSSNPQALGWVVDEVHRFEQVF